jgi:hypothetical protein
MTGRERVYPRVSVYERIAAKITFVAGLDGCWLWKGARSVKRRGQRRPIIRDDSTPQRVVSVARLMCEFRHGPAPSSAHEAGHTCPDGERDDCVAPHHLVWMTRTENEQWKQTQRKARLDNSAIPAEA